MGRQKNVPTKKKDSEFWSLHSNSFIPVLKRRKTQRKASSSLIYGMKIFLPNEQNKKFYLGNILIGTTNNVFPEKYDKCEVAFNLGRENEYDSIMVECDGSFIILVKLSFDATFLKEIFMTKFLALKFESKNGEVHINVYLQNLPLPRFYSRLGNCIKNLMQLIYNFQTHTACDTASENFDKNLHGNAEIVNLYKQISAFRGDKFKTSNFSENLLNPYLKPKLRPYQEEAVRWMLYREHIAEEDKDTLHPLYSELTLKSGLTVYYNKYTGYIDLEKPVVLNFSRGGILADEMGLGKTIEFLACVLLNKKPINNAQVEEGLAITNDIDPEELDRTPIVDRQAKKRKSDDSSITSELVDQPKKLKVPNDWVKGSTKQSQTKIALTMWYDNILSGMSTSGSKGCPSREEDEPLVQCICGSTSDCGIIECDSCGKYQHRLCLGYKQGMGRYLCPQCWMDEPLLECGGTLIVTPVTLRTQWCKEICRHLKGGLRVLQYDGYSASPVYPTQLQKYDLVITTYNVLKAELRLTECGHTVNLRKERKYSPPGSPLVRMKWWRLCLDEAQTVEAPARMVSEMAKKIHATCRWAITGTPISKEISDLQSLIDYLQITPYNDLETWKHLLYEPYRRGEKTPMLMFLSEVLWRTSKVDVLDQINIPKQTYKEHFLEFSAVEKYFYKREHELSCFAFLQKVQDFEPSLLLEKMDRSSLKKILAPLLTLRHACTHPNTLRGRYLATKKQVTSMKDLLNALILKNTSDSEECLRLVIASLNGLAGIQLLLQQPQNAIKYYREVLQLATRFSEDNASSKLTVDKLQVVHTMHNLASVLDTCQPTDPTLRDDSLRKDCSELEHKYMEKFKKETLLHLKSPEETDSQSSSSLEDANLVSETYVGRSISDLVSGRLFWTFTTRPKVPTQPETISALETSNSATTHVEKLQRKFILKAGQWYSDGLDWTFINSFYEDLLERTHNACDRANVECNIRNKSERNILKLVYTWNEDIFYLRFLLSQSIKKLYDLQSGTNNLVIKDGLVAKAMDCHLRPQKKSKNTNKCPLCACNVDLKQYEGRLFNMVQRKKSFEDMSLVGSWKPTLEELVMRSLVALLKARNGNPDHVKDGEVHIGLIESLKKEFKEIRRLWTFLDRQICARDELDICKVRLQLKEPDGQNEEKKADKILKSLTYTLENKNDNLNLVSVHELDYQNSLLANERKINMMKLEKALGTQSYLETLRKQQYEGQSPDPCPICKNTLENHWSILLCGHSYCLECIQLLLEQNAGENIQCSVCRNKQRYQEISYIKAGSTVTDEDCIKIKGNYSTKIEAVIKLLLQLKSEDAHVKVLVFSSWLSVLKCVREALETNGVKSEIALNSKLEERIENFKDSEKGITAFLLPISLGSKGLNLIEATHVILVEPLLNPADELQAVGRVHRIGQRKPTTVHKFLIKDTIEESIYQATSSDADSWDKNKVTLQQLTELFLSQDAVSENSNGFPETSVSNDAHVVEEPSSTSSH